MKPKWKVLKKFYYLFGFFLLAVLLLKVDFHYYKELIKQVSILKFSLISCLSFPPLFLKAYRWKILMSVQNIRYSLLDSFLMYQSSTYVGTFTPGRIGEVWKSFYLKKDHSLGKSLVSTLLDRFFDIFFLFFFGLFGIFLFSNLFEKTILFFILFLIFFVAIAAAIKYFGKELLRKIFYFFIPKKYQEKWHLSIKDFFSDMRRYKLRHYLFGFFITGLVWFIFYLSVYLFSLEIGINQISFLFFSSALAVGSLVSLLPFSVLGIGTRDAALIIMFSSFGVRKELIIAVSMFVLFLTLVSSVIGFFSLMKKPMIKN